MKKNDRSTATIDRATKASGKNNGHSNLASEPASGDFTAILASLQTVRDGDFSVRLPGSWTGLAGKIADTFNEIVAANQQMAQELKRVGQVVPYFCAGPVRSGRSLCHGWVGQANWSGT